MRVSETNGLHMGNQAFGVLKEFQVGNRQHVDPRRAACLAEIHRTELAGADDADPDRIIVRLAAQQHSVQIQWPAPSCANRIRARKFSNSRRIGKAAFCIPVENKSN